jgi:hypothetical protein
VGQVQVSRMGDNRHQHSCMVCRFACAYSAYCYHIRHHVIVHLIVHCVRAIPNPWERKRLVCPDAGASSPTASVIII